MMYSFNICSNLVIIYKKIHIRVWMWTKDYSFVSCPICILMSLGEQVIDTVDDPKTTVSSCFRDREARDAGGRISASLIGNLSKKFYMSTDGHKDILFFGTLWEMSFFQCFLLNIISHCCPIISMLRNANVFFFFFHIDFIYFYRFFLNRFLRLWLTEHAIFVNSAHLYTSFYYIPIIPSWNIN